MNWNWIYSWGWWVIYQSWKYKPLRSGTSDFGFGLRAWLMMSIKYKISIEKYFLIFSIKRCSVYLCVQYFHAKLGFIIIFLFRAIWNYTILQIPTKYCTARQELQPFLVNLYFLQPWTLVLTNTCHVASVCGYEIFLFLKYFRIYKQLFSPALDLSVNINPCHVASVCG